MNNCIWKFFFLALGLVLIVTAFLVNWPDIIANTIQFIQSQQRAFHDSMGRDLHGIQDGSSMSAFIGLVTTGFFYGILHAAGPGHGKIVIASYMLANERSLKRGIIITALSSLMQALVAIFLVIGLFYLFGLTRSHSELIANWFEIGSFALIACLGFILTIRGLQEINHSHSRKHSADGSCCTHHTPSPQKIISSKNFSELGMIILSIGIRPCSGALLLLAFAMIIGTAWAGIAATFAMAIGTAITTSFLAIIAVQSKSLALRFLKLSDKKLSFIEGGFKITGGLILIAVSSLFLASAAVVQDDKPSGPHPLMQERNR